MNFDVPRGQQQCSSQLPLGDDGANNHQFATAAEVDAARTVAIKERSQDPSSELKVPPDLPPCVVPGEE